MTSVVLKGTGYASVSACADALATATNSLTLGADTYVDIVKEGNTWTYWCLHDN